MTPKIPSPADEKAKPLICFAEESIEEQRLIMPVFDEWGIVPAGHRGPRPNPWAAEPECMGESPDFLESIDTKFIGFGFVVQKILNLQDLVLICLKTEKQKRTG